MNPRSITQDDIDLFEENGLNPRVVTFAADDPTFTPTAALITDDSMGSPVGNGNVVRVPWQLDEIELMHLATGGTLWLSTWGGLPPHALFVQPKPTGMHQVMTEQP